MSAWWRRFDNPYLLATLTVLFWSGNWVVGRGMREAVPPISLAFWRWSVALLCLLPFTWPHRRAVLAACRSHWRILLALALLGITAYNTLTYIGLRHTTATNGVLLNAFIPLAILLLGAACFGKPLQRREVLGMLLSLAGVFFIVARGEWATLATLQINPGDLWVMVSVLVWALYTLLLQYRPPALPPLALVGTLTALGVAMLLPLYLWELAQGLRVQVTPVSVLSILYTGVFPAFLGYIFWNRAVEKIGGARAGLFIHLMPPLTAALAGLFLGEMPQLYHAVGLLLILAGILLATRRLPVST